MAVFVPVLFQRPQAALFRAHGSFQFVVKTIRPGFIVARQRLGLFPAHLGDVLQVPLHLLK